MTPTSPLTPETLLGVVTRDGDDARVTFDRRFDTDAADLWRAVTEPDRLARWFAPVDGDLRVGGDFTIQFDDAVVRECRLVSCRPPQAYAWEWPHAGSTSLVTVAVEPAGDGARLLLTHDRLTVRQAPDYAAGWEIYVRRLEEDVAGRDPGDAWADAWPVAQQAYAATLPPPAGPGA